MAFVETAVRQQPALCEIYTVPAQQPEKPNKKQEQGLRRASLENPAPMVEPSWKEVQNAVTARAMSA